MEQVDPGPVTMGIAAIVGVAAVALAIMQLEDGKDAINKAYELSDRILNIQEEITNHWATVQHPQAMYVMDIIYGLSETPIDYTAAHSFSAGIFSDMLNGALYSEGNMFDRYRVCDDRNCIKELEVAADESIVATGTTVDRYHERRYYREAALYAELAMNFYHGSRVAPDGIFHLLEGAQVSYMRLGTTALSSAQGYAQVGIQMATYLFHSV